MKILLLEDVVDTYYNLYLKANTIVTTYPEFHASDGDIVVAVHGHGCFTYARKGQWDYLPYI